MIFVTADCYFDYHKDMPAILLLFIGGRTQLVQGKLFCKKIYRAFSMALLISCRTPLGTPEIVITGIPSPGHNTRTLVYDGTTSTLIVR